MSDTFEKQDWGDIDALNSQGRSWPKIGCCCLGCVVPLLLMGALLIGGMSKVRSGLDQSEQWARLDEILPYQEAPPGFALSFGLQLDWFDFEFYVLLEADAVEGPQHADRAWLLMSIPGNGDEFRDGGAMEPWHAPDCEQPVAVIDVQGQSLPVGWLSSSEGTPIPPGGFWESDGNAPLVFVQLPSEAETSLVLLVTGETIDSLTIAEVTGFLDYFQLGVE